MLQFLLPILFFVFKVRMRTLDLMCEQSEDILWVKNRNQNEQCS